MCGWGGMAGCGVRGGNWPCDRRPAGGASPGAGPVGGCTPVGCAPPESRDGGPAVRRDVENTAAAEVGQNPLLFAWPRPFLPRGVDRPAARFLDRPRPLFYRSGRGKHHRRDARPGACGDPHPWPIADQDLHRLGIVAERATKYANCTRISRYTMIRMVFHCSGRIYPQGSGEEIHTECGVFHSTIALWKTRGSQSQPCPLYTFDPAHDTTPYASCVARQ